jgi:hypothetical protein
MYDFTVNKKVSRSLNVIDDADFKYYDTFY